LFNSAGLLKEVWIIPVWGFVTTVVAHGFGFGGQWLFKLPNWTIVAAGRPNSSALPLLLIEALSSTGVLDNLKRDSESQSDVLDRAKSLILLNVIVQQALTFLAGPSILTKGQDDDEDASNDRLLPGSNHRGRPTIQDTEHVGLLNDHDAEDGYGATQDPYRFERPLRQLDDTPDLRWPEKLQFMEAPTKKVASFLNPPVVGAIIAITLGMISPLHHAFLDKDGTFYNSITKAVDNLGKLFVSLQMFTVGAQLATVKTANPKVKPTAFVLFIRYVVMPAIAIFFVWMTAGRGFYADDPLVWFLLILLPSGPSAMVLANLAELVDTDQGPIAGYLTIAVRVKLPALL
jgi:predicted permease